MGARLTKATFNRRRIWAAHKCLYDLTFWRSNFKKPNVIGALHHRFVFQRRVRVLAERLTANLAGAKSLLDVGCGDGSLAKKIAENLPGSRVEGVDVLPRETTQIPVAMFDGKRLPCEDQSVDAILCVDVLHHTEDPLVLLREFHRVARQFIVIKDHFKDGPLAFSRLAFMDWVGNARYGVNLPYNYLTQAQWREAWETCQLRPAAMETMLGLYPFPFNVAFESGLHYIVKLEPQ